VVITVASIVANDSELDGEVFDLGNVFNASGGTILHVGNSVTFTPATDRCGTDAGGFDYNVFDGRPGSIDIGHVSVTVTCVPDAPVNTVPATVSTDEDTPLTFDGADTISVADVDTDELEVTVSVTGGTFSLSGTDDLDVSDGTGTDDTSATFSGTQAAVNAALDGLVYTPTANGNGSFELTISTSDGTTVDGDTVDITVDAVNDLPVVHVPGTQVVDEDGNLVFSAANGNAITVTDVDAAPGDVLEVRLDRQEKGTFTYPATTGLTRIDNGSTSYRRVYSGTLADINAALDGIAFTPDLNDNGGDYSRLTIRLTDLAGALEVPGQYAEDVALISVTAVNDAPVVTAPASIIADQGVEYALGLEVEDVDAGDDPVTITISVTGRNAQFVNISSPLVSNPADTQLTYEGPLSDSDLHIALAALELLGPQAGSVQVTITANDNGSDGAGGPRTTTEVIDVTVVP
jgi:hypothetical protein